MPEIDILIVLGGSIVLYWLCQVVEFILDVVFDQLVGVAALCILVVSIYAILFKSQLISQY